MVTTTTVESINIIAYKKILLPFFPPSNGQKKNNRSDKQWQQCFLQVQYSVRYRSCPFLSFLFPFWSWCWSWPAKEFCLILSCRRYFRPIYLWICRDISRRTFCRCLSPKYFHPHIHSMMKIYMHIQSCCVFEKLSYKPRWTKIHTICHNETELLFSLSGKFFSCSSHRYKRRYRYKVKFSMTRKQGSDRWCVFPFIEAYTKGSQWHYETMYAYILSSLIEYKGENIPKQDVRREMSWHIHK